MQLAALVLASVLASGTLSCSTGTGANTPYAPMMRGDTPATSKGWTATPIFTFGETAHGYTPPGVPDGIGAFPRKPGKLKDGATVLVNHELSADAGYPYTLANGTTIPGGARVSYFALTRHGKVEGAGLAYDTIYDRAGNEVTDASQLEFGGLHRLCSARSVQAGEFGLADNILMAGEEAYGGTQWILDVDNGDIWAAPAMGRGAWEGWTPIASGSADTVALLGGDDRGGAPLYLYLGTRNATGDGSFLDRNGLARGALYCWKADNGDIDSSQFRGFLNSRSGRFVEVGNFNPGMAGLPGYDALGYADQDTLDAETAAAGCFRFSRPEDLHNDPLHPGRAVMASTGRRRLFPADSWGTVYVIDADAGNLVADIRILHDADALPVPDQGIRSPDNLTWANDGDIYVQEDRSVGGFGAASMIEASVWQLSPDTGAYTRIAEMCRDTNSAGACKSVAPIGSTDADPDDRGDWESSGVLDVTEYFATDEGETLLLIDVQAHSIRDGVIASADLVEGGQLLLLRNAGRGDDDSARPEPPAGR